MMILNMHSTFRSWLVITVSRRSTVSLGFLVLFCCSLSTNAQSISIDTAVTEARSDLRSSLEKLAEVEASIAEEKIPLSRETFQVEKELRDARQEWDALQVFNRNQALELDRLESSSEAQLDDLRYREGLLQEYLRAWESRMDPAEWDLFPEALAALDRDLEWENMATAVAEESSETDLEAAMATLNSLETAISRLESSIGGRTTTYQAADSEGRTVDGTSIWLGPSAYFVPESNDAPSGVLIREPGAGMSRVFALPGSETDAMLREWIRSGSAEIPLDVTGGKAIQVTANAVSLMGHLKQGGIVMVPLLALAFFAILIAIWKALEISRARGVTPKQLDSLLTSLANQKPDQAMQAARAWKGPASELLQLALGKIQLSRALLEELLFERILREKPRLERGLAFLAVTAATAPLLGLLGTVIGMIKTFQLITLFGTGDAKTLSGGISEALITTEVGLVVAIPALILHAMLSRRVKRTLAELEQTATAFLNGRDLMKETQALKSSDGAQISFRSTAN